MDHAGGEAPEDASAEAFPSALERTLAAVQRTPIRLGRAPTAPRPEAPQTAAPVPATTTTITEPTTVEGAPPAPAPPSDTPFEPAVPAAAAAGPSAQPPVMPALPRAAPAPVPTPAAPTAVHLAGMTPQQAAAMQSGVAFGAVRPRRRSGARVATTVMLMVLAALLAGGGRYGFDWYERTEAANDATKAAGANAELAVGIVDPPAWQYVVVEATGFDEVQQFDLVSQVNLRDDFQVVEASISPTSIGAPSPISIDARGERIAVGDGSGAWVAVDETVAAELAPLLDNFGLPWVLTISDLVPATSLPFVTIVDRSDEILDIEPLDPTTPRAEASEAGTEVRRFVLRRDDEAYRAAELPTYEPWEIGDQEVDLLEIWIDEANIVRKLHAVTDLESITMTWTRAERTVSSFPPAPPVLAAGAVEGSG